MNDDHLIDDLLSKSMAAPAPQLPSNFDAKVMTAVRPRRLSSSGRAVIGAYAVAAVAISIWAMQDAGVVLIAVSTVATAAVSLGLSRYASALIYRGDTVTR